MDVDGTLTDGKIYIGNDGELFKAFNVKDGAGIKLLKENNIIPVIITGRTSDIVLVRARELGIDEIYQGVEDKVEIFNKLKKKYNITNDQSAFVGDDLNDLELMKLCGLKSTVANAAEELFDVVDYISPLNGGDGAVRDIINKLLSRKI